MAAKRSGPSRAIALELEPVTGEMRHMQAVLKAQISKTDRNNARGIPQMMRVVKTLRCQTADPLPASAVEGDGHP